MGELNNHIKHTIGIKPKRKRNYTKALTWIGITIITIVIWTTIYNLIF
jgi:hypothetical protein